MPLLILIPGPELRIENIRPAGIRLFNALAAHRVKGQIFIPSASLWLRSGTDGRYPSRTRQVSPFIGSEGIPLPHPSFFPTLAHRIPVPAVKIQILKYPVFLGKQPFLPVRVQRIHKIQAAASWKGRLPSEMRILPPPVIVRRKIKLPVSAAAGFPLHP